MVTKPLDSSIVVKLEQPLNAELPIVVTPKGIIKYLGLREPIFTKTTNYGHFGKSELSWEKIIELK